MPPSPVVSDIALAALRDYAAAGGRLVLFAPFNTLDVNLRAKGDAKEEPAIENVEEAPAEEQPEEPAKEEPAKEEPAEEQPKEEKPEEKPE